MNPITAQIWAQLWCMLHFWKCCSVLTESTDGCITNVEVGTGTIWGEKSWETVKVFYRKEEEAKGA